MKLFTKLALVSAVAISGSAMAMESMDDSALSSATGQDGISLGIGISRIEIAKMYIHDNDGLATTETFNVTKANPDFNDNAQATYTGTYAATYAGYLTANPGDTTAAAAAATAAATAAAQAIQPTFVNGTAPTIAAPTNLGGTATAGAIVVNGIQLTANTADLLTSHNLADVTIDTDGGNGAGAFLNIGAKVSGLNIKVGSIGVAQSGTRTGTEARRGIVANSEATILSNLNLVTGRMDANIQLGNTPQGAMIALSGTMNGGLAINGLNIHDAAGGGRIVIDGIKVSDAGIGNNNLSMDAKIGVTTKGLEIIGGGNATDVYVKGIRLDGSLSAGPNPVWTAGSSIGDVEINGMQMFHGDSGMIPGAKITVSGH